MTQDANTDIPAITAQVQEIETAFLAIDEARANLTKLETVLGDPLKALKGFQSQLHKHWHDKQLYALKIADPAETAAVRALMDRVDALVKRLTPSPTSFAFPHYSGAYKP